MYMCVLYIYIYIYYIILYYYILYYIILYYICTQCLKEQVFREGSHLQARTRLRKTRELAKQFSSIISCLLFQHFASSRLLSLLTIYFIKTRAGNICFISSQLFRISFQSFVCCFCSFCILFFYSLTLLMKLANYALFIHNSFVCQEVNFIMSYKALNKALCLQSFIRMFRKNNQ